MSDYVPELYITEEDGTRVYQNEAYRKWYDTKQVMIWGPVFYVLLNLFFQNPFVNAYFFLTFALCLYRVLTLYPLVRKLDRERYYRARDLGEKEKLEASREALPAQEPHGRMPPAATI